MAKKTKQPHPLPGIRGHAKLVQPFKSVKQLLLPLVENSRDSYGSEMSTSSFAECARYWRLFLHIRAHFEWYV